MGTLTCIILVVFNYQQIDNDTGIKGQYATKKELACTKIDEGPKLTKDDTIFTIKVDCTEGYDRLNNVDKEHPANLMVRWTFNDNCIERSP